MSVQLDQWLDSLMPQLPGASLEAVKVEMFNAAREFFEDGRAWTHVLGPLDVTANVPTVDLTVALQAVFPLAEVGYVWQATFTRGGTLAHLRPLATIPPGYSGTGENPLGFTMDTPGVMRLLPTPTLTHVDSLHVEVTVIPSEYDSPLPDFVWTHYRDAIIDGTLGRMFSHPSKPYSEPQLATYRMRRFRNFIKRARQVTGRRYNTGANNWAFPSWA